VNTLPAQEVKRRGVKAIELALANGPVHIIKNNAPVFVVLSEVQYAQLVKPHRATKPKHNDLLQWILTKKASGSTSRSELDTLLAVERDGWDS
jgi:hypothetical protein